MHVRGYKEKGNINTPMELAIENETDRFSLAIDVIDRVPKLQEIGIHAKEKFRKQTDRVPELRAPVWHRRAGSGFVDLAVLVDSDGARILIGLMKNNRPRQAGPAITGGAFHECAGAEFRKLEPEVSINLNR